jgi:glycine C-acetyltransferase/8-amino-7-oxononanoate synthase
MQKEKTIAKKVTTTGRREFLKQSVLGMLAIGIISDVALDEILSKEGIAIPSEQLQWSGMYIMESAPGPITVINGKSYLYFGGTGYYALHGNPQLIEAAIAAVKKYGIHPGTSRSGFGNNPVLLDVEKKIADFFGTEDAFYFVSGYLGPLVLVQALRDKYDVIVMDETSHFAIRDAVYSTNKRVLTFKHRDPEELKRALKKELKPNERPLLCTDGIFPTFGVIAPVPDYVEILKEYNGLIVLDDAHAVGVLGSKGRGTYDYFGLQGDNLYFSGTLSKAFGGEGGFICGSKEFIEKAKATTGIYSGATPTGNATAAAAAKGIEIVKNHPEMRQRLYDNVKLIKAGLKKLGFPMNDTPVPIVTWSLKSAEEMLRVHKALMDRGIVVPYSKYVGAPAGGVLRASIFAEHTEEQLNRLINELSSLI